MIIYNKGDRSDYIIFEEKLSKIIKEKIKPTIKKSLSRTLYSKIHGLYFYDSISINRDYKRYQQFLSFNKYLTEILFIYDEKEKEIITANRKILRVKHIGIYDSMALFNYIMYFARVDGYQDEISELLEENYELL